MTVQITLGQRTDRSSIDVPGSFEGRHLMDVEAHPYGNDLYSSEKNFQLIHPPTPEDLFRRYGDRIGTGTPYHSDQAFADIRDVAKYNLSFLGPGWVNEKGEVYAEAVYDACYTQADGQPGALIREEARRLRRIHETPPAVVQLAIFKDLEAFFSQTKANGVELKYPLPWTLSVDRLPPSLVDTPEKRMSVVLYYYERLKQAEREGRISVSAALSTPFGPRAAGPAHTDVGPIDLQSFYTLVEAYRKIQEKGESS